MSTSMPTPPALILSLTEGSRALSDLAWFYGARPWLARQGSGNGRPVLVLPGLEAGDWSTKPLRSLLDKVGYTSYGWELGTNVGPTREIIEGLDALVDTITRTHDQPLSVVGQSLGGFLGAEVARRNPGAVDRLITLGSPMAITDLRQSRGGPTYARYADRHLPEYELATWLQAPHPPIPSSSIYSPFDGVIHPSACLYQETPLTENIRTYSSHFGMGVNPAAVYAVLDRLAVSVEPWRKFEAPTPLRAYYPQCELAAA